VFHLKYRPQKISELDSVEVRETLLTIFSKKELPQSFLFSGPKGSGKTSAARIVAKLINCEDPSSGEPCGKCGACKTIEKGRSTDIVEIDAASNRGIDDVRVLRDQAYLLPTSLKKKVFIVDEVHMMTKEAFNALLKLLEEPPAHTTFILCTTDAGKIPETVLSRLVRVNFKKGKKAEVIASLRRSMTGEGMEVKDEVLELVYKKSEGSFRNAQRMLTEIVMELGDEVADLAKVENCRAIGFGGYAVEEMEVDLMARRAGIILEKLEIMAEKGGDFGDFRNKLIEYFQNRMLGFYGVGEEGKGDWSLAELVKWLNLLIVAGKSEKDTEVDQLPLEMAVVEFLGNEGSSESQSISSSGEHNKEKQKSEEKISDIKSQVTVEENDNEEETKEELHVVENVNIGVGELEAVWGKLLSEVKPFNHSVEAFLRSARPSAIERNTAVIEVYYPFHKDRLSEDRNRRIVEDAIRKLLEVNLLVEFVVAKDKKEPIVIDNNTDVNQVLGESNDGESGEKEIFDIAKEIFG